ncbi:MAG: glutamate 5-kinase [Methanocorpusculum sp.]|nr:glutamate 5-kinase [Methanocorpusculum sp.]
MRIVIKVGTSTLAHTGGRLNIRRTSEFCRVLSDLKNSGHEIVLVSSGAIGMGVGKLGLTERPKDMVSKQAAAAVGQCELMYVYDRFFAAYNHTVGQLLLTAEDISDEKHSKNIRNTLEKLISSQVIPVINENDAVATDEIGIETTIGENDTLAAITSKLVHADMLIMLSDIDGLYTADPRTHPDAQFISCVTDIDSLSVDAQGAGSSLGSGGMNTKMKAAQIVTKAGIDMVIINGTKPELLYDLMDGKSAGTLFKGKKI